MKKLLSKSGLLSTASVLIGLGVLAGSVDQANAGAFGLREQSAIGQGSSFAGMAAPTGSLSSMYWNPATLTATKGTNSESVYSFIAPEARMTDVTQNLGNTKKPGDVGLDAMVPGTYGSMQLTDDLFLGASINAPFGLTTKAPKDSATGFHAATSEIFSVDAKASIAYRVNEMISVGAALGVQYFKVRLTSYATGNTALQQELKGDDFAPSYSLGMTLSPMDGTDIGIGFRGAVFHKLEGTQQFSGAGWAVAIPIPGIVAAHPIHANLVTPEKVTVGLRQRVNDAFTVMAGFEWTNWSRVGAPPINGSPTNSVLGLHYEDSWFASAGAEYAYNEDLTLRAGVGYETSPIPVQHRNMRLADADRLWVSAGLSYQINEKLGVDLGYSHLFVEKTAVSGANQSGSITYTGHSKGSVDILSASLRYQWKPEPMFAGDDPIVRKY